MNRYETLDSEKPVTIHAYLITLIKQATQTYLTREQIPFDVEQLPVDLRFSAQSSFGDYSMPIMPWAGKNMLGGGQPLSIAEPLAAALRDINDPAIEAITVTKPGFLNFRLNRPAAGKALIDRILEPGADFGRNNAGPGTRGIVEHNNIDSNKAAQGGHRRNAGTGAPEVRN